MEFAVAPGVPHRPGFLRVETDAGSGASKRVDVADVLAALKKGGEHGVIVLARFAGLAREL